MAYRPARNKRKKQQKKSSKEALYRTKRYQRWRNQVFARDRYQCRLCGFKGYLEAHHIRRKFDHPELTYRVGNGIALCKAHHSLITGFEKVWVDYLTFIVKNQIFNIDVVKKEFEQTKIKEIYGTLFQFDSGFVETGETF